MVTALLNSGDTAWMLVSTAMVMLMTIPGLALFYGGLVKKETVLNTLFLSFSAYAIVSIIWFIYGYPVVFGADIHGLIGAPGDFFFHNVVESNTLVGTIPTSVYAAYQMTFAAITVALISGALIHCTLGLGWRLACTNWCP
jgi:Amt family ammonium transporter